LIFYSIASATSGGDAHRHPELEKINQEQQDKISALKEEKRQSTDLRQQQNQSVPDYEGVRDNRILKKLNRHLR
jgi:hypothetical protein